MKKISIISYTYPPANAPAAWRPYYFAKYLNKDKFEVDVLTCGNQDSSLGFDPDFNPKLDKVKLIAINALNIKKSRNDNFAKTKKKSVTAKIKSFILKFLYLFIFPDKGMFWYPYVRKFIHKNKKDLQYDIILSTAPLFTNHLVALLLLKHNPNAIYIADFRDFHYIENHAKKKGIKSFLHKYFEKKIIEKADAVLFISHAMKEEYAKHYTKHKNKFNAIYNGYDFKPEINDNVKLPEDKLHIFYAGSFYQGIRSPFPLLNILDELLKQKIITKDDISIDIAGSIDENTIEQMQHYHSFTFVNLLGKLPRNEVLQKYKQSHLLWLIVGNSIEHYTGLPIKFYEYLAANRPVINFAPDISEPSKVIKQYNLGWNFDTHQFDINQAVKTFKTIWEQYQNNLLTLPNNQNDFDFFSRKNQTKLLEKIIDKLI
jgi:glycosyltransferase involved in cell wall biosynthesis